MGRWPANADGPGACRARRPRGISAAAARYFRPTSLNPRSAPGFCHGGRRLCCYFKEFTSDLNFRLDPRVLTSRDDWELPLLPERQILESALLVVRWQRGDQNALEGIVK